MIIDEGNRQITSWPCFFFSWSTWHLPMKESQ